MIKLTYISVFSIIIYREVIALKEVYPNYYNKFLCIADKCKHSCCIGWEIDIDEDTMDIYNSLNTPMGEKIRSNIEGDIPHFKLTKDDRCPFLNENGLCDIILECGDGAISDICYLHPRFSNFYSSFTETGLGLCCEEAVRVILSETEKFKIDLPNEKVLPKEKELFEVRQNVFDILQSRNKSIKERFLCLAEMFGLEFKFDTKKLVKVYNQLERLDEKWTEEINSLTDFEFNGRIFENAEFQIFFEQLSVYFVFRHLVPESNFESRIKFVLMSCWFIGALCEKSGYDKDKMFDLVRMYSSEIEYSEDNLELFYN